jgi:hypothetical protein
MSERFDYLTGNGVVPVIPYDTFEAANLFLAAGRAREEVLPLIGLSGAEWEKLRETYRRFPTPLETATGETISRGWMTRQSFGR